MWFYFVCSFLLSQPLAARNVLLLLCLQQHFACMLYKFGCQWFLKTFLEMGTAFSGIPMSLNFVYAVFIGPLFIMQHV